MLHKYLNSGDIIFEEFRLNAQRRTFQSDLDQLVEFKEAFEIDLDLDQVVLNNYDALVLTDKEQTILWVNSGFEKMTGYESKEALGKKPTFLQGEGTSEESKAKLRKGIINGHLAKSTLLNYRKNGDPYICQISILPLKSSNRTTSHFLAVEREIK